MMKASRFDREYAAAKPFPHVVRDFTWPDDYLERVLEEWPEAFERNHSNEWEKKRGTGDRARMGPKTIHLLAALNKPENIKKIERLTGIPDLIPDPDLRGGGLHNIDPGGYLKIHTDFTVYKGLYRRINLIVYLNKEATEETGGRLQLVDTEGNVVHSVVPKFNRTVIFTLGPNSWHGHPEPWKGKEARKSIALYYYTKDPGDMPSDPMPTRFKDKVCQ